MTGVLARGDIVLVSFPFTDRSGSKIRPAVIVNLLREDVLLAFISSVVAPSGVEPTDFILTPSHPDFSKTGLKSAATFKLGKLVCLHRSLILRRLGRVGPAIQRDLDIRLARAVGLA